MPEKIVVVDDHPMVCEALANVALDAAPKATVLRVGTLSCAMQTLESQEDVDLVLLDLSLPDTLGLTGLLDLRIRFPRIKILVTTAHEEPRVVDVSFLLGAKGFLTKSSNAEVIQSAISNLLNARKQTLPGMNGCNGSPMGGFILPTPATETLTTQQTRILRLLCEGQMNKVMAFEMGISEATIKAHVSDILRKFGMTSRTQAILAVINPFDEAVSTS